MRCSLLAFDVGCRYKTRAHKAEGKLQEEASKQKTEPPAPEAGEGATQTTAEDPQLLNKVLPGPCSDVIMMSFLGEDFARGEKGIGGKVGGFLPHQ